MITFPSFTKILKPLLVLSFLFYWTFIYFCHYLYYRFATFSQIWFFNFDKSSAIHALGLSFLIPTAFFTAYYLCKKKTFRLFASTPGRPVVLTNTRLEIKMLIICFVYILLTFLFLGAIPIFSDKQGDIIPGQILFIVLSVILLQFVILCLKYTFATYKKLLCLILVIFILANILFTSRIYFFSAFVSVFLSVYSQRLEILSKYFLKALLTLKLKGSFILTSSSFSLLTLLFIYILQQYTVSRGRFFLNNSTYFLVDLIYQRSLEAFPQSAELLFKHSSCIAEYPFIRFFEGFSAFLPYSIRTFFMPAPSIEAHFQSIHASSLVSLLQGVVCLNPIVQSLFIFAIFLSIYLLFFKAIQSMFILACKSMVDISFVIGFSSLSFLIFSVRSDVYFWPLQLFGFMIIVPRLVVYISRF